MTIKELKELLQEKLDNLEQNYNDDQEVDIVSNTYFLRNKSSVLEIDYVGFVSLDSPVDEDEEDQEEEEED